MFAASFESHTESRGPAHAETKVALDGLIAALERSGEHESAAQFRALAVPVPEQEAPAAQ